VLKVPAGTVAAIATITGLPFLPHALDTREEEAWIAAQAFARQ
jgi:hypothetical protein